MSSLKSKENEFPLPTALYVSRWDPPKINISGKIPRCFREEFSKKSFAGKFVFWDGWAFYVYADVSVGRLRTLFCELVKEEIFKLVVKTNGAPTTEFLLPAMISLKE